MWHGQVFAPFPPTGSDEFPHGIRLEQRAAAYLQADQFPSADEAVDTAFRDPQQLRDLVDR